MKIPPIAIDKLSSNQHEDSIVGHQALEDQPLSAKRRTRGEEDLLEKVQLVFASPHMRLLDPSTTMRYELFAGGEYVEYSPTALFGQAVVGLFRVTLASRPGPS